MKNVIIAIYFMSAGLLFSQDFLMQTWYWDYPKTINGYNWADTLTNKAQELSNAGFTYLWLPPLSRASFGNGSNGYDPKDLYDLGEFELGATGFGTRQNVDDLILEFNNVGINAIADVVFNHRDGGEAEDNLAVEEYIETYYNSKVNEGYNPFPYDRFRCYILLGGTSGNGAGDYYFKVSSASGHSKFNNYEYNIYIQTTTINWQNLPDEIESEPNGGGDCGQSNNNIHLGVNMNAEVDDPITCRTDEFHLNLTSADFDAEGDTLFIYFGKRASDYSDMRIYGIWSGPRNSDIVDELKYQTYTDFSNLPSGQGLMNYSNFKPNSTNATKLDGDWDWPWFFYDYDQNVLSTKNVLFSWTKWLWEDVGIGGLRMDAVKHFPPEFVGDLFDYLHDENINPQLTVGEFYEANPHILKQWIENVYLNMDEDTKQNIIPRIFDFSLRQSLKDACDWSSDVRNIFNSSIVDATGLSGFNVVTFVGNHDFRDEGQYIQNNSILAYAYILTNNQIGLPCVFYPDYYTVEGFPTIGNQNEIDKLISVHKKYITGLSNKEYLSNFNSIRNPYSVPGTAETDEALVYQLMDEATGSDVIVAINFSDLPMDMWIGVNEDGNRLGTDSHLFDVVGNGILKNLTVTVDGRINIKLPPKSYSVWVEGVTVQTKVFLEGAYNTSLHLMNTTLNDSEELLLTSPFAEDLITVTNIDASITDWILIELYEDLNNEPIISKSVFVKNDGWLALEDGSTTIPLNAPAGNYYIVIKHRNHLTIASAEKISLSGTIPLNDFTTNKK
ncbi:MAG: hypothetical protein IPH62_06700 [Ignavibacteriae bacterium]|nr:hypothetical protein [Ignavibacteriota bacterium]